MNLNKSIFGGILLIACNILYVQIVEGFEINAANKFFNPGGRGVSVSQKSFKQKILGADSKIYFNAGNLKINSCKLNNLEIEYRATNLPKVTFGQLYFAFDGTSFAGNACWLIPALIADGEWHTLTLKASDRTMYGFSKWRDAQKPVTKIRLDLIEQNAPGGEIEIRCIRFFADKPAQLRPVSMLQHYIEPDKPVELKFKTVKNAKLPDVLSVNMLNFDGECYAKGTLHLNVQNGEYSGNFTFPAGFSELSIPQAFARFGVTALADNSANTDMFWGINVCFSKDDLYYRILNRLGIKVIRKYHPTNEEISPGVWSNKNEQGYEFLLKSGQKLLTYHNAAQTIFPATQAKVPKSFLSLEKSVKGMFLQRGKYMTAYQLLNELDSRSFPASEYIPFYSAVSFLMNKQIPTMDLLSYGLACGGGYNMMDQQVIENYLKNDLLCYVDKLAFHTYSGVDTILPQIRQIRNLLKKYPKGDLPVWITESGMPWKNGLQVVKQSHGAFHSVPRAPQDEDIRSAWQIAGKACLAKAAGIEKYFVFIWNFFPESSYNFGVIDLHNTPHRSFSAYAFCANILGGLQYCGDLPEKNNGVYSIPVFSDGTRHIAVIIASTSKTLNYSLPVSSIKAYAIDGRPLTIKSNGKIPLKGICYAVLNKMPLLNKNTEAMALSTITRNYHKVSRQARPVVIRYIPGNDMTFSGKSYIGLPTELRFLAGNLSDKELTIAPEIQLPQGRKFKSIFPETITLAPKREKEFSCKVDLSSSSVAAKFSAIVRDKNSHANFLYLPFLALEKCQTSTIDFNNPSRWSVFRGNRKSITFSSAEECNALKISSNFSADEKHVFGVRFAFNEDGKVLKNSVGISFDIRADFYGSSTFFNIFRIVNDYHPTAGYQLLNLKRPSHDWTTVTYLWPEKFNLQTGDLSFMASPAAKRVDIYLRNIKILYH